LPWPCGQVASSKQRRLDDRRRGYAKRHSFIRTEHEGATQKGTHAYGQSAHVAPQSRGKRGPEGGAEGGAEEEPRRREQGSGGRGGREKTDPGARGRRETGARESRRRRTRDQERGREREGEGELRAMRAQHWAGGRVQRRSQARRGTAPISSLHDLAAGLHVTTPLAPSGTPSIEKTKKKIIIINYKKI